MSACKIKRNSYNLEYFTAQSNCHLLIGIYLHPLVTINIFLYLYRIHLSKSAPVFKWYFAFRVRWCCFCYLFCGVFRFVCFCSLSSSTYFSNSVKSSFEYSFLFWIILIFIQFSKSCLPFFSTFILHNTIPIQMIKPLARQFFMRVSYDGSKYRYYNVLIISVKLIF